jgi:hypothetical protein
MNNSPVRFLFAIVGVVALALGMGALQFASSPLQAATPRPYESAFETPPPLSATATPSPSGQVVRYAGQLLDVQNGFVFFTTGDGFRLSPTAKIDDPSGGPTKLQPVTRVYARAAFDTGSGAVVELALSTKPLPNEASYQDIQRFAIAVSTPAPNPELAPREGFSGRDVLVTFTVEVPARTPFGDTVYLATDISGWSATAIRMDRIDALHYKCTQTFKSGTKFLYRYTRGSWQSAERGQNGLEVPPRQFLVRNADVQSISNVVYHWGDEQSNAPDLGSAIPTPFNPIPFKTPPPAPYPTPPHH